LQCILSWLVKYEAVAVWIEGLALVGIFGFDVWAARRDHRETVAQLKLAQDQIKISQNAERAWILTDLVFPEHETLKITSNTSREGDGPEIKTTAVSVRLICRNEGRSLAWVDKIQAYCEIVDRLRDLPSPIGHSAEAVLRLGPVAPGKLEGRGMLLTCPGHAKHSQILSIFVLVEYRDIFEQKRVTTCGYTVIDGTLFRQEGLPERNRFT
jgi:hypothetical protein